MDIHERQSAESDHTWQLLNFFTVAVCAVGFAGNLCSLFILVRHREEIAGSRLLLTLGVTDLGVVLSIALRTLAYVTYGYGQLTLIAEWAFLYWYYCSIYVTVFLSLDRCLSSANSMLLLKIDYSAVQKKVTAAIFSVAFLVTIPHLLGNTITYHYGSHTLQGPCLGAHAICNIWCNRSESAEEHVPWKVVFPWKEQTFTRLQTLKSKHHNVTQLLDGWCLREVLVTGSNNSVCKPFYLPAPKFVPHLVAGLTFWGNTQDFHRYNIKQIAISVSNSMAGAMRHDPDFVKAVYLGIDLLMRYVIPCIALLVINVRLLVAVYRAQQRHNRIIRDPSPVSLFDLPVLKSVGVILVVFAICQAGGMGIYITDVMRAFAGEALGDMAGDRATFLDEKSATDALCFRYTAYLLAAVNSSVNILIYCLYLPTFRRYWKEMFDLKVFPSGSCKRDGQHRQNIFHVDKSVSGVILPASQEETTTGKHDVQNRDDDTQLCDGHLRHVLSVAWHKTRSLAGVLAALVFFILILAVCGRIFLSSTEKDFDYKFNLKPARFKYLDNYIGGICVSRNWLVVTFSVQETVRLYSLPGLLPGQEVNNVAYAFAPRSTGDGLVYVPSWRVVTELKISPEGSLSVRRNITVHGMHMDHTVDWWITSVAVGPQTAQLCILRWSPNGMALYIVHIGAEITVEHTLSMPERIKFFSVISALHTGQVLVTMRGIEKARCFSVLYQEQRQLSFLTNLTQESCTSIAYRDHFLVVDYLRADILVLDGQGALVHTVDYGTGYITKIRDLSVWQDSVFVINSRNNGLLLLSPF